MFALTEFIHLHYHTTKKVLALHVKFHAEHAVVQIFSEAAWKDLYMLKITVYAMVITLFYMIRKNNVYVNLECLVTSMKIHVMEDGRLLKDKNDIITPIQLTIMIHQPTTIIHLLHLIMHLHILMTKQYMQLIIVTIFVELIIPHQTYINQKKDVFVKKK